VHKNIWTIFIHNNESIIFVLIKKLQSSTESFLSFLYYNWLFSCIIVLILILLWIQIIDYVFLIVLLLFGILLILLWPLDFDIFLLPLLLLTWILLLTSSISLDITDFWSEIAFWINSFSFFTGGLNKRHRRSYSKSLVVNCSHRILNYA